MRYLKDNDFAMVEKKELEALVHELNEITRERDALREEMATSFKQPNHVDGANIHALLMKNNELEKELAQLSEIAVPSILAKNNELEQQIEKTKELAGKHLKEAIYAEKQVELMKRKMVELMAQYEESVQIMMEQEQYIRNLKENVYMLSTLLDQDSTGGLVNSLHQQLVGVNGGEAHITLKKIQGDDDSVAVVSVYRNQQPANEVVDQLFQWARMNNDEALLNQLSCLVYPRD